MGYAFAGVRSNHVYRDDCQGGMMRAYYGPSAWVSPLRFSAPIPISHDLRFQRSIFIMRARLPLIMLIVFGFLAGGCVYQAAISQGNLLDQEDIDQVEVGMTRGQIRFLLGTPMIADPFHENRWDYVYYLRIGRKKATAKRWISVFFDGDSVTEVVKDQDLRADL
jgi:outer membrane protein assembly factor BamE